MFGPVTSQGGFDDRMAALRDGKAAIRGKAGTAPIALDRALGIGSGDIQARYGLGGGGDCVAARRHRFDQFLEMRRLGGDRMAASLGDPRRLFVQLGRVEPDHARQRLPVGEAAVRRHQRIAMLGRHLDMIAEHAIVPDLERGDPGFRTIAGLKRGDRLPPVARHPS
jgi:hypothetical protein